MTIGRQIPLHVKTINSYSSLMTEIFSGININLALEQEGSNQRLYLHLLISL